MAGGALIRELAVGELRLVRGWELLPSGPTDLDLRKQIGDEPRVARVSLRSHYVNWVWQPGQNTAFHFDGSHHEKAPAPLCNCGLYGVFEFCNIPTTHIVGVVEYWGVVRMGNLGIRAQHARIIALAPGSKADYHYTRWAERDQRRRLDAIGDRYEATVRYTQRDLLETFRSKLSTPDEFGIISHRRHGDWG